MKGPIVIVPEGEHSALGPSSAERWINCPGSVLATRGIKDEPSVYALDGTAGHTVSEWVRLRGVPAATFKGTTLRITRDEEHWDVYCGKPMVLSVQQFVDRVEKLPGLRLVEERVDYTEMLADPLDPATPPMFGTSDDIRLNDWLCYVGDYKQGSGVRKNASMNEQMLLYALGTWLKWRWAYTFDTFDLRIYQPRIGHFDQAEITLTRLLEWTNDVARPMAQRALQPGAPFKAGDWCKFCRIRDTCRVRAEYRREKHNAERANDFENLDAA